MTRSDATPGDDTRRVVGRIGRAHGVRGLVTVDVRTDSPAERFAAGAVLGAGDRGTLRVETAAAHSGKLLVRFEGIADRSQAETLRGIFLTVSIDSLGETGDPDEFFDHQLEGLIAVDTDGGQLGVVREVAHAPASDLLVLDTPFGEALIPFVREIALRVELEAGRIVLDPPPGLIGPEGV